MRVHSSVKIVLPRSMRLCTLFLAYLGSKSRGEDGGERRRLAHAGAPLVGDEAHDEVWREASGHGQQVGQPEWDGHHQPRVCAEDVAIVVAIKNKNK